LQKECNQQEPIDFLFNAVNEQGYLFQGACEHALRVNEKITDWEVKAVEYPVIFGEEFSRAETRVDIILHAKGLDSPELYALVECKRTNPSYINWIFGAPDLPFGEPQFSTLGLQCSRVLSNSPLVVNRLVEHLHFGICTYAANNWLEAKKGQKSRTSTPQNIENVFIQVLRGIGGFAQEQLSQRYKGRQPFETFYIPVVVTTAKLYVAYYKLEDIDLSTGTIDKDRILFGSKGSPAEEEPWVVVDYNCLDDLPGIGVSKPTIPYEALSVDPSILQKYKSRSVFVVNSNNLVKFFSELKLKSIS